MALTKHGTGDIISDNQQKVASKEVPSEADREALAQENEEADAE